MKGTFTLIVALLALLFASGCETGAHKEAVRRDEMELKLQASKGARELNDQRHVLYVKGADKWIGENASSVLMQCYLDGYDSVQNDDDTFRNAEKLGPKYVEKCNKIVTAVKQRAATEEKQHEKEITQ